MSTSKRMPAISVLGISIPPPRVRIPFTAQMSAYYGHFSKNEVNERNTFSVDKDGNTKVHVHSAVRVSKVLQLGPAANAVLACACSFLLDDLLKFSANHVIQQKLKRVKLEHLYDGDIRKMPMFPLISGLALVHEQQDLANKRAFTLEKDGKKKVDEPSESTAELNSEFVTYIGRAFHDLTLQHEVYAGLMMTSELRHHLSELIVHFVKSIAMVGLPIVESNGTSTYKVNTVMKTFKALMLAHNRTLEFAALVDYVNNRMKRYFEHELANSKKPKSEQRNFEDEDSETAFAEESDEPLAPTETPVAPVEVPVEVPVVETPAPVESPATPVVDVAPVTRSSRRRGAASATPVA